MPGVISALAADAGRSFLLALLDDGEIDAMSADMIASQEIPCLLSAEQIAKRVAELATQISSDYAGRQPLLIGVLKGAWIFMADLVRHLTVSVRCDFVKLSSYGGGTATTGQVQLHLDLSLAVEGQDVVIVEDIVDSGTCAVWLLDHLRRKKPASIRLCALLDKPSRRVVKIQPDYLGFEIGDHFVVGYGIDWNESYRELPYIGHIPSGGEAT
jgi:hypoxanthine phosphoribosyltransferase